MRFNLKEETFVSLRSPPLKACEATDGPCDAAGLSYYVTEVDGKVCLVTVPFSCSAPRWHRYNAEVDGRMDVWMLESPAEDRWFLRYSIDLLSSGPRFIPQPCFIRGEKILLHDRDGDAYCRDLQGRDGTRGGSRGGRAVARPPPWFGHPQVHRAGAITCILGLVLILRPLAQDLILKSYFYPANRLACCPDGPKPKAIRKWPTGHNTTILA
jgi:hypothetical protein